MEHTLGTWRELITRLEPAAEFFAPASEVRLSRAEERLGNSLPGQLRSLLSESDGVYGEYGLGLIWSLDRIVTDNESHRNDPPFRIYMPLGSLLFFGDAGDGELFGHPVTGEGEVRDEVFVWNPIEDTRILVADSVRDYLHRWLDGRLKL